MVPLCLIALVLAVFRVVGFTGPIFQAIAHVFVGGLFGAYFAGRKRSVLLLALALTAVEVACFLAFRAS